MCLVLKPQSTAPPVRKETKFFKGIISKNHFHSDQRNRLGSPKQVGINHLIFYDFRILTILVLVGHTSKPCQVIMTPTISGYPPTEGKNSKIDICGISVFVSSCGSKSIQLVSPDKISGSVFKGPFIQMCIKIGCYPQLFITIAVKLQ